MVWRLKLIQKQTNPNSQVNDLMMRETWANIENIKSKLESIEELRFENLIPMTNITLKASSHKGVEDLKGCTIQRPKDFTKMKS